MQRRENEKKVKKKNGPKKNLSALSKINFKKIPFPFSIPV